MAGTQREPALMVELVGAAGTGKTSLAAALAAGGHGLRTAPKPSRRRYASRALSMLPALTDMHRPFRRVLFMEAKRALYLAALRDVVNDGRHGPDRALVFDEGPVYMLARILVFGGANVYTRGFRRWWRITTTQWAQLIDVVVHLDAPDDVLIERIRTRRQPHPVKDLPVEDVARFLGSYRRAYDRVIDDLLTCGGPHVVRLRADIGGVDSLVASTIAVLDGVRRAPLHGPAPHRAAPSPVESRRVALDEAR